MDEAPSVSTSMWSIAAAGIWLTSTKFLPLMPPTPLLATRRPSTRISVGRFRSCNCEPPAVRWLSLLALLVPALLRPAKEGIALRSISRALVVTPFCSSCLASSAMTGTATASGAVGSSDPVTVIVASGACCASASLPVPAACAREVPLIAAIEQAAVTATAICFICCIARFPPRCPPSYLSLRRRHRLDVEPDDSPAGLALPGGHRDVQAMQLGDQNRGLRAHRARHLRELGEVTGVDLRVDPDVSLAARRVHPPIRDVEDFRVDALRCGETRNVRPGVRVEHDEPARIARHDKEPVGGLIELHQRVLCGAIDRPLRHDPASGLVYHSQIVLVGDVDVQMRSVLLNGHGLDVIGVQVHFAELVRGHRINLFEP